jgi:hypothetical protein
VGDSAEEGLLSLAQRVVALAKPGEQIEVYASRLEEVDVRAFDGEIESLSSARTAGVGIRVVADGRQGFAYAGALEDSLIAATLADARDNATFATPDEYLGLAVPDGLEPVALDLWDPAIAAMPTTDKVQLALDLEKSVRGSDPRVQQVVSADYGTCKASPPSRRRRGSLPPRGALSAACRCLSLRATTPTGTPVSGSGSAGARRPWTPKRSRTTRSNGRRG